MTKSIRTVLSILVVFLFSVIVIADQYKDHTDAAGEINSAINLAKADGKNIMLMFGADWCPWCRLIAKYINENETVKAYISENYHIVKVDVGKFDKNLEIIEKYNVKRDAGVPSLVVLNSRGEFLVFQETGSLEEGKGYSEEKVLRFLKKYRFVK
ncbi:MAG: thioredoxin family protein [Acidobacteria bacterium]|nr:thioredoxin family protein [Acidobacteriota bacterium]